jgi:hypothetical protein
MRLPHHRRAGFALIEVMMLLFALTIAIALGTALLVVTMKANGAASKTLVQLTAPNALADRFRADVAAAGSAVFPPQRGQESAASDEIILPRSETEQITYRFDNGIIVRLQRVGEKVTRQEFPIAAGYRGVSFRRSEGMVTMRLHGAGDRAKSAPTQDITAALGGDRR